MYPKELKYTKTHEWTRKEEKVVTVGITSFAVEELSDIVYVELPSEGDRVEKGSNFGVVESVKAVVELYSPVSGEIVGVNQKLQDEPGLLNKDPYGEGWIIKATLEKEGELDDLMAAEEYEKFVEEERG